MPTPPPKPDAPTSFGFKCAWYALRTNDVDAVVSALGIVAPIVSSWDDGIDAAYTDKVFITPPLGEWILAASTAFFPRSDNSEECIAPTLTRLSRVFGEAQFFATHRVVEAHCWALARNGTIIRAFEYVGERGEITWNQGDPTEAELLLGSEALEFPGPDEGDLMQVAGAWSIDPSELESNFTQPSLGLVGEVLQQ